MPRSSCFLSHHDIPASKYHETLTRAWVLAVDHFMHRSPSRQSADDFIDRNPMLLDSKIMLTHYSAEPAVLGRRARRVRRTGPGSDTASRGLNGQPAT